MTSKSEKEVVYLPGGNGAEPGAEQELLPALDDMTPREIVLELDKYIVGQAAAKRAVAVALRYAGENSTIIVTGNVALGGLHLNG